MEEGAKRRVFDTEFKRETVRLVVDGHKRASEVARDLGIEANTLYRWKREMERDQAGAFPGKGKLKPEEEEIRRLRKEFEEVREERDILKKALAVFSRRGK